MVHLLLEVILSLGETSKMGGMQNINHALLVIVFVLMDGAMQSKRSE